MIEFKGVVKKRRWSHLAEFPPSKELGGALFACGDGVYLRTDLDVGDGDSVRSVGWAESDYWALRAWNYPPFAGELMISPAAEYPSPPSLGFLGRPENLTYKSILEFEKSRPQARAAGLVTANYRMTDGEFVCVSINGTDGITYIFPSNEPHSDGKPVAIEFKLRDG